MISRDASIPEEINVLKPHPWPEQFPTFREELDGGHAVLAVDAK